jgi:leader peptidase (prepilin peptidase)/N-methyltransferase
MWAEEMPALGGLYILTFLSGLIIGSIMNTLIGRLPLDEEFHWDSSHCRTCGAKLAWYERIPLFGCLLMRGKCRKCGARISIQYPSIEALNGIGYVLIFAAKGFSLLSILYCLMFSVLTVIAVIDWNTYEIPLVLNICIGILGILRICLDFSNLLEYLIGFCAVSAFLAILYYATGGRGIGGGDVKLMAAAGLFLGWKNIILALALGSIIGSIIHIVLMKACKKDRVLAFGPYLSAGILLAMLFGDQMISWYLGLFF